VTSATTPSATTPGGAAQRQARPQARPWTFLTNHAHVLLAVAADPDPRVSDIAERVGIAERQALAILRDLEVAGYLQRTRAGRRTHHTLHTRRPFRHAATADHDMAELLAIFAADRTSTSKEGERTAADRHRDRRPRRSSA